METPPRATNVRCATTKRDEVQWHVCIRWKQFQYTLEARNSTVTEVYCLTCRSPRQIGSPLRVSCQWNVRLTCNLLSLRSQGILSAHRSQDTLALAGNGRRMGVRHLCFLAGVRFPTSHTPRQSPAAFLDRSTKTLEFVRSKH